MRELTFLTELALESPTPMFICPSGKLGSTKLLTIPSLGGSRKSEEERIGRPVIDEKKNKDE